MRDYGKVHTSFWSSLNIRGLSEDGRILALYLLTSPHATIAGAFRLPDGYVCEDMKWTSERVSKGFRELFNNGFANRCETTQWVWVYKHFEWNAPENPNQRKAVVKLASQIPDACIWKARYYAENAEMLGLEPLEICNPSETLREPLRNQEQEQEQEQKQEKGGAKTRQSPPVTFKSWIESIPEGEDAIPPTDPIYAYAERVGLPEAYLRLEWAWFKQKYLAEAKRQKDWRQKFRNAVEGGWGNLWRLAPDGTYFLTTQGQQLERSLAGGAQ